MRDNAGKSFLGKVKDKRNFYLALHAHVTKIDLDKTTKEARGIEVKIGEKVIKILAEKEIILSAGSINSPQLLMLSGIGPKEHLESVGIEPIVNLPLVGKNLQDHVIFGALFVKMLDNAVKPSNLRTNLQDVFEYFTFKTGELAGISLTSLLGFFNTKNDSIYPNIEFDHIVYKPGDTYLLPEVMRCGGYNDEVKRTMMDLLEGHAVVQFNPILLNPKSRGYIALNSKDSEEQPMIYSGYFTDENQEDIEVMLEGIR